MYDHFKVIFIFQSMNCLNVKKGLNGLTFSLPPKYLEYADYLVNFE